MSEKKDSLVWQFTKAAVKLVTVTAVIAVTGQLFWDSMFFGDMHDPTNKTMVALKGFVNDYFGFIAEWAGTRGDGGFLNTEFAQAFLEPYYPEEGLDAVKQSAEEVGSDSDKALDGVEGSDWGAPAAPATS